MIREYYKAAVEAYCKWESCSSRKKLAPRGTAVESLTKASGSLPENSLAPNHSLPSNLSSISTTHENKGVTVTKSLEVPGKSGTDGTCSTAGRTRSLSLDTLDEAKKALQMQKELSETCMFISCLTSRAHVHITIYPSQFGPNNKIN